MKASTASGKNTVRVDGMLEIPYYVALQNGPNWSILERDASLSGAIARQTALHTANPGNTYGVFQYNHVKNGVVAVQVA